MSKATVCLIWPPDNLRLGVSREMSKVGQLKYLLVIVNHLAD